MKQEDLYKYRMKQAEKRSEIAKRKPMIKPLRHSIKLMKKEVKNERT